MEIIRVYTTVNDIIKSGKKGPRTTKGGIKKNKKTNILGI